MGIVCCILCYTSIRVVARMVNSNKILRSLRVRSMKIVKPRILCE
jgi:hypothetical protein